MTGALLRTGSLDVFHPLGAEGNPVHTAAAQVRAAIARRLGREAADTFAVPQRNEDGDTIDWYAPNPGPVVPWSSATEDERAKARKRLEEIRGQVEDLGREMAADPDPQRQGFARLLAHICTFPSEEHVYLVDDRPVISFWGFRHHNAPAYTGAMLNVDALRGDSEQRRGIPWWWWLVGLIVLGALLLLLLRSCSEKPPAVGERERLVTDIRQDERQTPEEPRPFEPSREWPEPQRVQEPLVEPPPVRERPPPSLAPTPGLVPVDRALVKRDSDLIGVGGSVVVPDQLSSGDDGTAVTVEEVISESIDEVTEEQAVLKDAAGAEVSEILDPVIEDVEVQNAEEIAVEDAAGIRAAEPVDAVQEDVPEDSSTLVEETGVAGADLQQDRPGAAEETAPGGVAETPAPEIEQEAAATSGAETGVPKLPDESTDEVPLPDTAAETRPVPDAAREQARSAARAEESSGGQTAGTPSPGGEVAPAPPAGETSPASPSVATPQGPRLAPMIIPADAFRTGSVRFANGGWRSSTSLQDGSGLPVDMGYRLADGAGRVELRRHDGAVCAADVKAAMRDGKLIIDSLSDITCPDGTSFGRPSMECTPGLDGRADCSGRYGTGERFSVDLGKLP